MSSREPLVMTISLNALEHLGINLYSNMPAVLSEIVANAWDADATQVNITLDANSDQVIVEDNGIGMTRRGVNDRFLTVGFRRRDELGPTTELLNRRPMGRKGIGKLSTFSVAGVVEVYTRTREGECTAFRMDRDAIREAIKDGGSGHYQPEELSEWPETLEYGTKIVLSELSKSLTLTTQSGLKKRIARRFSIIGPNFDFSIAVNGSAIVAADRGYHDFVQYLWTYSADDGFADQCTNKVSLEDRTAIILPKLNEAGISLRGWIGTVFRPDQLKDDEGDNLNRIAIFMRGKLAQEDILGTFGEKELYADYIVGELHCETLDEDEKGDIATSSRQALKEDDPRFEELKRIVGTELRHIASKWSDLRRSEGTRVAAQVPEVAEWLDSLQGDTKRKAEKWVGRHNTIRSSNEVDKKELLKASILAFESFHRKEDLDRLDQLSDQSLEDVLSIFRSIDDLEQSYYGQIVNNRLQVIRALHKKVQEDQKELVIRDYIFKHLWLLDPSWERTTGTEIAEAGVKRFLSELNADLEGKEKTGRLDIAYRTASGKHIIIELKRASISVEIDTLMAQIRPYRNAIMKLIEVSEYSSWPIEIICLLGDYPREWYDSIGGGKSVVEDTLSTIGARVLTYDQLLQNAERSYKEYLDASSTTDRLWKIFAAIDDFSAASDSSIA